MKLNSRLSVKLLALFAVLALFVAACGEDEPEAGPLGQVVVNEGESIQIRSLNAISGDVAFLGVPNQRGVETAIADFGEIQGFSVDMGTGLDDLCSPEGGQAAAQTIVSDERVVGVIGTSCSGAAVAASPLISDGGLVMLSASNTSPALTSNLAGAAGTDYHPGYYRTAHNDLFQGEAVANYAFNELGLRAVAAVHDGDPYTNGLATAFADAFRSLGGEIPVFTAVNKGDTDMVPVLTEVAAGSPDGMFFPIFPPEGNFIAQQISQVPELAEVTLMSADGMLVENFLEIPESAGVYFSGPSLQFEGNENEATGRSAQGFLDYYNSTYGEAPSAAFWAHAYDATTLLLTAIQDTAEEVGGNLYIDRQAVREALNGISNFQGLTGVLTCDGYGDCGSGRIQIVQQTAELNTDSTALPVLYEFTPEG